MTRRFSRLALPLLALVILAGSLPARVLPTALAPIAPAPAAAAELPDGLLDPFADWFSKENRLYRSPVWGDINNDGYLDLAVGVEVEDGNENEVNALGVVEIFPNLRGALSIQEKIVLTTPGSEFNGIDLAWGDFTGAGGQPDGFLDLAVANDQGQSVIFINRAGRFSSAVADRVTVPFDRALALAPGDIDNNGTLDLAIGGYSGGAVYKNTAGGFSTTPVGIPDGLSGSPVSALAWGDVNVDGKLDLAVGFGNGRFVGGGGTGRTRVLVNVDGSSWATDPVALGEPADVHDLAWGNMDGQDGPELAVVSDTWVGEPSSLNEAFQARIYTNVNGTLSAGAPIVLEEEGRGFGLAWADAEGDGDLDLAVSGRSDVALYLNQSGAITTTAAWESDTMSDAREIAWGDMDGDGALDLAVAQAFADTTVFRNRADGIALSPASWPASGMDSTTSLAWGDVDNDGDLDLAVGNENWTNNDPPPDPIAGQPNRLFENIDGVLSQLVWSSQEADDTNSIAWGDMDNDGDLDLAAGNYGQPNRVYENEGGKLLPAAVWSSSEADQTTSVAWADVDGNDRLDLFAGNNGESRLYLNFASDPANGVAEGLSVSASQSFPTMDTRSAAFGDIDQDGDLDLALGNDQQNALFRNVGGRLIKDETWQQEARDSTQQVAWGDMDNDGDLDLATSSWGVSSKVYLNTRGTLSRRPAWESGDSLVGRSLAWGDVEGDGDLDLAVGNWYGPSRVYLNENRRLGTAEDGFWVTSGEAAAGGTRSVAWGDIDGDGRLDLALGRDQPFKAEGRTNLIYRNLRTRTTPGPVALRNDPPQISVDQPDGGPQANFFADPTIFSSEVINIPFRLRDAASRPAGAVRAEFSLDGGGSWRPAVPAAGANLTNLATSPAPEGAPHTFPWNVYKSDFFGQSDNVVVRLIVLPNYRPVEGGVGGSFGHAYSSATTFPFRVRGTQVLVQGLDTNTTPRPGARVFRLSGDETVAGVISDSLGHPYLTGADGYLPGRGTINADDQLIALWPIPRGDQMSEPGSPAMFEVMTAPNLAITDLNTVSDSITIAAQGTISSVRVVGVRGQHTWTGDLRFSLQSPAGTRIDLLASECGSNDNFHFSVADDAPQTVTCPLDQGQVYQPLTPLAAFSGESTQGAWQLFVEDTAEGDQGTLIEWGLSISMYVANQPEAGELALDNRVSYYYTSAPVTADGLDPYEAQQNGVQTLSVSANNALALFNLSVALEWDARNDAEFMQQLRSDMLRVSELLYDWSDGQVALGKVTIYHDKQVWATELDSAGRVSGFWPDIQIFANNRLRPNATQGGIVVQNYSEMIDGKPVPYTPGTVRMNATWSRSGVPGVTLGEDWPRALAHEIGHYALFLDDNYYGLDENGVLTTLTTCRGAMTDPYRDDYSEFHPNDARWAEDCAQTLSERTTGRSDWETIEKFHSFNTQLYGETLAFALRSPASYNANPGPNALPLAVTEITEVQPASPPPTIAVPIFTLVTEDDERYVLDGTERAILYRAGGQGPMDLGSPLDGQVLARGARAGDELCIYDQEDSTTGCVQLEPTTTEVVMRERAGWQPDLRIFPTTTSTVGVRLRADAAFSETSPLTLSAEIFPDSGPSRTLTLTRDASGLYGGNTTLDKPTTRALVRVWVPGEEGLTETVAEYSLGGNPVNTVGSGRRRRAPALSSDGQVVMFTDDIAFNLGDFFAFQTATALPPPPPWAIPVGRGYHLLASVGLDEEVANQSIAISYFSSDAPPGTEGGLRMYYKPAGGGDWEALPSQLSVEESTVTGRTRGEGLYVLMTTVPVAEGWNIFSFPWSEQEQPVDDAMEEAAGQRTVGGETTRFYTTIYGFEPNDDADPWKVFDTAMPAGLNDLTELQYGRGYWLNATAGTVAGGDDLGNNLPPPIPSVRPGSYYATVAPRSGYTPAAGRPVRALVNGVVCAETATVLVDGEVMFLIDVRSYQDRPGCGDEGRAVTIEVDGQPFAAAQWQNSRPLKVEYGGQPAGPARVFLPEL